LVLLAEPIQLKSKGINMLILTTQDIHLEQKATDKSSAIAAIAADLTHSGFVEDKYVQGMLEREAQASTFLGNGIAIPHGTPGTRQYVKKTAVCVHHFPQGVDWGNGNTVYVAIGIAAQSDEHLEILKQLTHALSNDDVEQQIKSVTQAQDLVDILSGKNIPKDLIFDEKSFLLDFPATDLTQLLAVAAGMLKNRQIAQGEFVAEIINQPPRYLGSGVWLAVSNKALTQSGISIVRAKDKGMYQDNPVKLVIVIAAFDRTYWNVIDGLTVLIYQKNLPKLINANAMQMITLLTKEEKTGEKAIFTITNAHGLHARPGATLVSVVKKFSADIWVSNLEGTGQYVKAKSLMKVIGLGVKKGNRLCFLAKGKDAKEALEAIGQAIADRLGE